MSHEAREMSSDASADKPPSPLFLGGMVLLIGPFGVGIVMQGLGSHVMDWLHPNAAVPRPVFLMLGLFVVSCTALMLLQLVRAPGVLVNLVGGVTIALSLCVFNWMVFDGGGQASCFIGPFPALMFGSYGSVLCGFVIKAGIVLTDMVALLCPGAFAIRRVRAR